jgi:hypothetical protein
MLEKLQKIQNLIAECIKELSKSKSDSKFKKQIINKVSKQLLDFSLNDRAFIKKYGKNLSGPKKFVLLVAYIARGGINNVVESKEITKKWNKVSSFMGGKSQKNFGTRAKENGWLNSPKYGSYVLSKNWGDILN